MSKFDHSAEGYADKSAVDRLYKFNQSESTDIGGQGKYVDWYDLPRAARDSIKENRDAQDAAANDGVSWRNQGAVGRWWNNIAPEEQD